MNEKLRFKSLLFIPAIKYEKKIYARLEKEADALIIDLEDSVPTLQKAEGRANLEKIFQLFTNKNIYVRINSDDEYDADMAELKRLGVTKIVYPKFEIQNKLTIDEMKDFNIIPIIETPLGMIFSYEALISVWNIDGVLFGAEDFSAALGISPSEVTMTSYAQSLILSCAAIDTYCYGYASDFTFLSVQKAKENCVYAKSLGFKGAFCVHPSQLRSINEIFAHEDNYVQIDVHEGYPGVSSENGKMIGPPAFKRINNQ